MSLAFDAIECGELRTLGIVIGSQAYSFVSILVDVRRANTMLIHVCMCLPSI
jgi:hypothetical protein